MIAPGPVPGDLRPNPGWASLPLFDRKGWRRVSFGEFAESINERVEPADAAEEIYVGLEHLDPESLHIRRWGKGSDVIGTKLRFRKGDIIFGRRRAYQRKLAVAEFDGIYSAHAMVVRAKPKVVLPEFLPFLMMSDRFMNRAVEISVGSLSPTINWKALKNEEFDLPPLEQQRRIAEVLWAVDETCSKMESAAQSVANVISARLQDALIIDDHGTQQPRFPTTSLNKVVTIQTGVAKGKKYSSSMPIVNLPYLRVANVQDGYLDLSSMKNIVVPKSDIKRYLLREGDVLICEGGDFDKVGRGCIWRGEIPDCLHQNHIFCLRADQSLLLPEFLTLQLNSLYGKRYFLSCAKKTSNLASINSTQVKKFPLQLPSLKEQQTLVDEVRSIEEAEKALKTHISSSRAALKSIVEVLV